MNKKIIPFLLIAAILSILFLLNKRRNSTSHYFNGQIEYHYTYSSNNLDIDSLSKIKPSKSIFRFDKLNYQSKFFEKDTFTYYYLSQINKAVSKINSKMNDSCKDYSLPTDSIRSFKLYDTGEKVLGYTCRILEFETNLLHILYWVSNDLKITPATYKQHLSYNWSFYGEQTNGGLILKSEHRFKDYSMSGIATSITIKNNNFKALEADENLIKQICNN